MFLYVFGISASRQVDARFCVEYYIETRQVDHPDQALDLAYTEASGRWPEQDGWKNRRAKVTLVDRVGVEVINNGRIFASSGLSLLMKRVNDRTVFDYAQRVDIVRGPSPDAVRNVILRDMIMHYPPHKGWGQHDATIIEITSADFARRATPVC